jgi:hypothetical protein
MYMQDNLSSLAGADATTSSPSLYKIASNSPLQKVSVQQLVDNYGAKSFTATLDAYLKLQPEFSGIQPCNFDKFNVYKHFDIPLAHILLLSETSVPGTQTLSFDKVCAVLVAHDELHNMDV